MTKRKFSDIDENLDFDLDGTINIWLSEKKKEENKKISFKVIKTLVLYKFLAYNWNNLINYSINILNINKKIINNLPNPYYQLYDKCEIIDSIIKKEDLKMVYGTSSFINWLRDIHIGFACLKEKPNESLENHMNYKGLENGVLEWKYILYYLKGFEIKNNSEKRGVIDHFKKSSDIIYNSINIIKEIIEKEYLNIHLQDIEFIENIWVVKKERSLINTKINDLLKIKNKVKEGKLSLNRPTFKMRLNDLKI
jgi:hypothetical protein